MRCDTPPSSIHGDDDVMDEIYDEDELEYVGDLDDVLDNEDEENSDNDASGSVDMQDDSLFTFKRHSGSVFCGSFHPSGKLAVTGGEDDSAFVWNVETQEIVHECKDHEDSVIIAMFSHDGAFLATGDMGGHMIVTKCPIEDGGDDDWKLVWEYQAGDMSWGAWHHGARVLFGGTCAGEVYVWKIPSGDTKVLQGHGSKAECGKLLTDGRRLAVGYEDGTIKIWDLKQSTVIHTMKSENAHSSSITTLDTFLDNNLIATGGLDGKVVLTKSTTGKTIGILDIGSEVEAVSFSKDTSSGLLAIGTLDGCLSIWDVGKQTRRHKLSDKEDEAASGIVNIVWIDHFVGVACLDGSLKIFDSKSGTLYKKFTGHRNEILDLCYCPISKMFLTTSDDNTAKIFKFETVVS